MAARRLDFQSPPPIIPSLNTHTHPQGVSEGQTERDFGVSVISFVFVCPQHAHARC